MMVTRNLRAARKRAPKYAEAPGACPGLDVSARRSSERSVALARIARELIAHARIRIAADVLVARVVDVAVLHGDRRPTHRAGAVGRLRAEGAGVVPLVLGTGRLREHGCRDDSGERHRGEQRFHGYLRF